MIPTPPRLNPDFPPLATGRDHEPLLRAGRSCHGTQGDASACRLASLPVFLAVGGLEGDTEAGPLPRRIHELAMGPARVPREGGAIAGARVHAEEGLLPTRPSELCRWRRPCPGREHAIASGQLPQARRRPQHVLLQLLEQRTSGCRPIPTLPTLKGGSAVRSEETAEEPRSDRPATLPHPRLLIYECNPGNGTHPKT